MNQNKVPDELQEKLRRERAAIEAELPQLAQRHERLTEVIVET